MKKEQVDWSQLSKQERRKLKKELKQKENKRQKIVGRCRSWGIGITVVALMAIVGFYWFTNREVLPPTSSQGHIEQSPEEHIIDRPMGFAVQMHMLEHSDGDGPPGVIINYNCVGFDCEDKLVNQLTEIANEYPEFVYLAPFPGMTEKLAITREGKIEMYDSLDKDSL